MAAHPMMKPMHGLYGQPRDGYVGEFVPAIAEIREPAELIHMRQSSDHLLIAINNGGKVSTFIVGTMDAPGLELLSALDRASVQSALAGMQRRAINAA